MSSQCHAKLVTGLEITDHQPYCAALIPYLFFLQMYEQHSHTDIFRYMQIMHVFILSLSLSF